MTHNTTEGIEEMVEELKKLANLIEEETYFLASDKQRGLSGTQHAVAKDNLSSQFNEKLNTLTQSLHHQLQKAREESKGEPANKAVLLEALKTIGWDMRGNYPNERIVDHNGKSTCYRVLTDGVQVLGVSKNSATDFYFKTAKVRILDSGNAVSLGTDDCFILFMNHSIPDKTIIKDHSELDQEVSK